LRARLESLGEALGIAERVRFLGYVDDDDLASLYAQCVIFMELTRYEGFGLQVGEAMAAGAPIIATNIPAIREVVGTTEWLVDIADIDSSLPLRISVLLNDAGRRTRVAEAGRERAATFKWERTAKVTWDGLHGVLQEASCE
jgi:glycosyltransferase involved in cell wall biosynthesis